MSKTGYHNRPCSMSHNEVQVIISEALELVFHQGPAFINAYFQAATNLVDQDSRVSNDLPRPWRSALSKCFCLAKSYEWIAMTFYVGAQGGKRKHWLNFGDDLCLLR